MKIIDTHQHLWDLDLLSYGWCKNHSVFNRSFRVPDYLEAVRGIELEKSVHVEADVDEADILGETRMILDLAAREDNPIEGVVAGGRPEKPGFRSYLDQIAGFPQAEAKLKGVRRILHIVSDDVGRTPLFAENVASLSEYGLSFDLCVLARQLPIGIRLVEQCPDTSFILDHCGFPLIGQKRMDPWRQYIRTIAGFPNVVACKVSGVLANVVPARWGPDDLRPYLDQVMECFGWDRVMFGSDWPVCTLATTLRGWLDALLFLTQQNTESERRKLFRDNALRAYRLAATRSAGDGKTRPAGKVP
jgi:predicted TIM-barrel fold metal-dependent hydrolase